MRRLCGANQERVRAGNPSRTKPFPHEIGNCGRIVHAVWHRVSRGHGSMAGITSSHRSSSLITVLAALTLISVLLLVFSGWFFFSRRVVVLGLPRSLPLAFRSFERHRSRGWLRFPREALDRFLTLLVRVAPGGPHDQTDRPAREWLSCGIGAAGVSHPERSRFRLPPEWQHASVGRLTCRVLQSHHDVIGAPRSNPRCGWCAAFAKISGGRSKSLRSQILYFDVHPQILTVTDFEKVCTHRF